jgi:hypothetical protein
VIRRAVALLLLLTGLAGSVVLFGAPAAQAAKPPLCGGVLNPHPCQDPNAGAPSFDVCKTPPIPQMPGRGFSGWIDSGPASYDPNAKGVYARVQYPPSWATYDLGCVAGATGGAGDPAATLDTTIGNWLKGAATTVVALTNSLHRLVSPPTFLAHLDPIVERGSAALRTAIFTPWIGVTLLLVGCGIVFAARKGHLPRAVEAAAWAIAVMAVAAALWQWPTRAGSMVDRPATELIGQINGAVLGQPAPGQDPATARAGMLTDADLYQQWLQGELGTADSPTARKYGAALLDAQTIGWVDADRIRRDPSAAAGIVKGKQDAFTSLAGKIAAEDPDAYNHLKGSGGGRVGAGFESLTAAVLTCPFMVAADALIVVSLLILRFIVVFFPVIAVVGVFLAARRLVLGVFSKGLGSVLNAVVFAVGGAVNALAVQQLLGRSTGLPGWAAILLCGVVTSVLWRIFKPFRRLGSVASPGMGGDPVRMSVRERRRALRYLRRGRRHLRGAVRGGTTTGAGAAAGAGGDAAEEAGEVAAPTVRRVAAETWSRPADPPPADPPTADSGVAELPDPDAAEVYRRGEPIPGRPLRSDPVVTPDEGIVWRIWDPETGTYIPVAHDNDSGEQGTQ